MLDHSGVTPAALRPDRAPDVNGYEAGTMVDLHVEAGGTLYGPFRNEAYSPVKGSNGLPPEIPEGTTVGYRAKMKRGSPRSPGTILLSSPVLDDVTLFFDAGRPEILGWVVGGRGR